MRTRKSCKIPDDLNIFLSMIRQIASFSEAATKSTVVFGVPTEKSTGFFLKGICFKWVSVTKQAPYPWEQVPQQQECYRSEGIFEDGYGRI